MQTNIDQIKHDFGGQFDSDGASQFVGNTFYTNGGPINIGVKDDDKLPTKICELPSFLLSPYFIGRSDELQQIDRVFGTSSGDLPQCCVIHGMPGVGKTQLALKYATVAFQNGQYPYVFWVSASSVEKLSQDVSKMVDLLRLPGRRTLVQASRLTMARAWLEDSSLVKSWLVILDNVSEETALTLHDVLARCNCGGRILMTTRIATIVERYSAPGESSQLALYPPGIGDAVAMLSAGANLEREDRVEADRTDTERLVQSVGSLPLAIDQAASFIRETRSNPREVLKIYKSEEVSEILSWDNNLSKHEEKSVVATFMPALNRIQTTAPDAVTLLRLLCFCDPEGIPISMFEHGCDTLYQEDRSRSSQAQAVDKVRGVEGSWRRVSSGLRREDRHEAVQTPDSQRFEAVRDLFQSRLRLSKAIQDLQRLSLIAYALEGGDRIVRIHDVVHLLLRSKLMTKTEQGQWLEIAIDVVCKGVQSTGDCESPQNWSRCNQYVSHIESLEKFAEQYRLKKQGLLYASTWAVKYLIDRGLYEKAISLNKRTLERKENILGKKHLFTLASIKHLAVILFRQGKYREAEKIHRQTLDLQKSELGEKHPNTLIAMNNLAVVLDCQGKYKEAEEMHRQTLDLQKSELGEKHPNTLMAINNLAVVLNKQGKHREAEEIYQQTLDLIKSELGEKHPATLRSINNLAVVLNKQGKHREAEEVHRQTLDLKKSELGQKHPDTLTSIHNLAAALDGQGKYQEAEEIYRQTLDLRISELGEKHPDTLTTMDNLSLTYQNQDRWKEAEGLGLWVMETRKSVLGAEHPATLTSMYNLACIWKSRGRKEEAICLMKDCVELQNQVLGPMNPSTKDSLKALREWKSEGD